MIIIECILLHRNFPTINFCLKRGSEAFIARTSRALQKMVEAFGGSLSGSLTSTPNFVTIPSYPINAKGI